MLVISTLTVDAGEHLKTLAMAQPYRSAIGIDPTRIVWAEIGAELRLGLAYTPDDPDGAFWMLAMSRLDQRDVSRSAIRRIVTLLFGEGTGWELGPPLHSAPHLTLIRVAARH